MGRKEFVSVIIPTYNRAEVVKRAVDTVLEQSSKNWELIVVDDGSTDATQAILSPYIENKKVKYFKTLNKGVCHARNYGVRKAKGKYIFLLDSDDEFIREKINVQLTEMVKHDAKFSISNGIYLTDGISRGNLDTDNKSYFISREELITGGKGFSASFLAFRKEVFTDSQFDENLPSANDLDFILVATNNNKILFVDYALSVIHKSSKIPRISTNYIKKIEGYRILLKKVNRGDYQLNDREYYLMLQKLYSSIGLFNFLNDDYASGRKFLLKYFKNARSISLKYSQLVLLYIFSFFPLLFKILKKVGKQLWKSNLLKI